VDPLKNACELALNLFIVETNDSEIRILKVLCSQCISLFLFVVNFPIKLNNQLMFEAAKVCDE